MSIEWICYDDIFDDSRGHDNEKFDPSTWRDLRMAVVDRVQSSLRRESNRRNVVHCLDTRLRRLVGSILHEETTQAKAVRARELNAAKDFILDRYRTETKHDQTEDVAATVDDFAMAFLHLVDISIVGINDGDKTYRYRQESQQLFLDFLDEPQSSPRRLQEVPSPPSQRYCLRTPYHRDPYATADGDFLGHTQWKWLEHELTTSNATFNVIASGIQVLPDDRWYQIGESWSKFPRARRRLLSLVQTSRASGVKLMNRIVGPGFTLANMILPWHFRARPREYYASFNFGDVVLDWTASPPTATASVYGKDGLVKLRQVMPAERYTGDAPAACGPIHHVSPAPFFLLQVAVSIVLVAFVASILVNAVVVVVVPLQLLWRLVGFVRAPKLKRD
ncbi:hypothetical protein DYB37_001755 [Aphanomyces astaci]|uniref:PhoD-like phosphatase metallophosphatase domain-containing protein n=1 Tax=Aphanomyces astaci TaxID=112090 RepID=A0A3R7BIJ2_APHAT|nr:hypothetical protein DYB35_001816 [Aphanomyces astaci]RHZ20009.1 hypothetical protein DYB37_001755 [Aphanomyces astaci]